MKRELITQKIPKSPISEVFRTLRTNIQFMSSKNALKSILITSTVPGEGKSWIASNLATTFAQTGKKVVLVDADMRKGRQHIIFGVQSIPGLSNYLSGIDENGRTSDNDIIKYIKETEVENLYLIPAGNVPPNPSELLASEATINMIEKLKGYFDYIVFDGTPSLIVTDSIIISRLVDTTIIAAAYRTTKRENLAKLKRDVENVGGKVAGVIINKVPMNIKKYQSTYYYYSNTSTTSTNMKSRRTKTNEFNDLVKEETTKYTMKKDKETKMDKQMQAQIMDEVNEFLENKKK